MAAKPDRSSDPTEGGRWIVVDGRRWRATDPSIPEPLRQELVDALMAARRAIAAARRSKNASMEKAARSQVQNAKLALGERGDPWWEPTDESRRIRAQATVLALTDKRGADATICPSDVARTIGGSDWRSVMTLVRDETRRLALDGEVEVTQRGDLLDPDHEWTGPVRVRRVSGWGGSEVVAGRSGPRAFNATR